MNCIYKRLVIRRTNKGIMKKFLYTLIMLLAFVLALTGCTKCISTETSTVRVKVIDKYYEESFTTMVYNPSLKTVLPQAYPETYRITVEYRGIEYNFSDRDTYNKYSDKIGEYINGILETKKYDNGKIKYYIVGLKE